MRRDLFLNVPGRNFEEKRKFVMRFMYFVSAIMITTALVLTFVASIKDTMSCTYKVDAYDCQVHSKSVFRDLGVTDYPDITQAVIASRRSSSYSSSTHHRTTHTVYQAQFLDLKNNQLSYTSVWNSSYPSVNKEINAINRMFSKNEDFDYDFGFEIFLLVGIIMLIVIPVIITIGFSSVLNNYIYEEVSPNQYRPMLKVKGGGMAHASGLSSMFGMEQKQPTYDIPKDLKQQGFKQRQYQGPNASEIEIARNLQDDELTDIQKDFYDGNN